MPYQDEPSFPVPVVENVYSSWKPVDHGHPLRDATLYYSPPTLERVRLDEDRAPVAQARSDQFPLADAAPNGDGNQPRLGYGRSGESALPVVIKATPKQTKKRRNYSVYGSPDINYSKYVNNSFNNTRVFLFNVATFSRSLYSNPPIEEEDEEVEPAVEEDQFAERQSFARYYPGGFQRRNDGYFSSAVGSRSADFPNPASPVRRNDRPPRGGGIQYIQPPNRRADNDFYLQRRPSPVAPFKPRPPVLSIKPAALAVKHQALERKFNQAEDGETLMTSESKGLPVYLRNPDGSLVKKRRVKKRRRNNNQAAQRRKITVPGYEDEPLLRNIPYNDEEADLSFLKRKNDAPPPLINPPKEVPHGKLVTGKIHHVHHSRRPPPPPAIPTAPSPHDDRGPGPNPAHFPRPNPSIPLSRHPPRQSPSEFPLGNPYGVPTVHSRPEYFAPQSRPPIYQTRPQRLEGTFGPALPPKPEPTHLRFLDEDDGYYGSNHETAPAYDGRTGSQVKVYKSVRGMEYARPEVIMHVKESGELYVPDHRVLNPVVQPESPAMLNNEPVEPHYHGQEEPPFHDGDQFRRVDSAIHIDYADAEAEDRQDQWLPDFSDAYQDHVEQAPKVEPQTPATKPKPQVVFVENNSKKPPKKTSFSFPEPPKAKPIREFQQQQLQQRPEDKRPVRQSVPNEAPVEKKQPKKKVVAKEKEVSKPNYKYVLGAKYHDRSDDGEDILKEKVLSGDLFELCLKEVPKYLQAELCAHLQKQVKGNNKKRVIKRVTASTSSKHDPFRGIPTELPKQIKSRAPAKIKRVKVYRPNQENNKKRARIPSPSTTTSTKAPTTKKPATITTTTTTKAPTTKRSALEDVKGKEDQTLEQKQPKQQAKKEKKHRRPQQKPFEFSKFAASLATLFKTIRDSPLPPPTKNGENFFARPPKNPSKPLPPFLRPQQKTEKPIELPTTTT